MWHPWHSRTESPPALPPDEPPTPLDDVTLDVIIKKCGRRGMAWKDTQTFIGFLAKRIRELEGRK